MHKLKMMKQRHAFAFILLMLSNEVYGVIAESFIAQIMATKVIAAIAAQWAAVKTTVIVGAVTIEKAATIVGGIAVAAGTVFVFDKLWDLAMTKLSPTHRKMIESVNFKQWQLNEAALKENQQLQDKVVALKTELAKSEESAIQALADAQYKFTQYCEANNIDPQSDLMPQEGKVLRANIGLIYCCLRLVYQ